MKIEEIKYIKKNTKSYDLVFSLDNEQINITFNIYAGMIVEQLLQ